MIKSKLSLSTGSISSTLVKPVKQASLLIPKSKKTKKGKGRQAYQLLRESLRKNKNQKKIQSLRNTKTKRNKRVHPRNYLIKKSLTISHQEDSHKNLRVKKKVQEKIESNIMQREQWVNGRIQIKSTQLKIKIIQKKTHRLLHRKSTSTKSMQRTRRGMIIKEWRELRKLVTLMLLNIVQKDKMIMVIAFFHMIESIQDPNWNLLIQVMKITGTIKEWITQDWSQNWKVSLHRKTVK